MEFMEVQIFLVDSLEYWFLCYWKNRCGLAREVDARLLLIVVEYHTLFLLMVYIKVDRLKRKD